MMPPVIKSRQSILSVMSYHTEPPHRQHSTSPSTHTPLSTCQVYIVHCNHVLFNATRIQPVEESDSFQPVYVICFWSQYVLFYRHHHHHPYVVCLLQVYHISSDSYGRLTRFQGTAFPIQLWPYVSASV